MFNHIHPESSTLSCVCYHEGKKKTSSDAQAFCLAPICLMGHDKKVEVKGQTFHLGFRNQVYNITKLLFRVGKKL